MFFGVLVAFKVFRDSIAGGAEIAELKILELEFLGPKVQIKGGAVLLHPQQGYDEAALEHGSLDPHFF